MARKKKITEKDIYAFYMEYYLENAEAPKSVYQLAKLHNFDEKQFYDFFGGISGIEKSIFISFITQTLELLENSEEYQSFDERNKLLTFYYTFFEVLTANRSFVVMILERDKQSSKLLKTISVMKPKYLEFIRDLDIEKLDIKQPRAEKIINKSLNESFWVQLLLCLKFWMEDDSASLEKTDIYIEKSINTGFDLLNVQPLRSVLDLGKFLFHEKIHMN
ncbi:TetR family transcriptional regulator C-terminal domain-containing protein [Lutimonas sp.]|uniref:TetR family transcriptional regulator C-terminal domain-containing protein n=1 Tax=Lutimonas sp. TaxID=1872403 RepID=UPI003D9B9089